MVNQSTILSNDPIIFTLGTFTVSQWHPGFDPKSFKSTTKIWVRMYVIPLEFYKEQNLMNIAAAMGTPLKIDSATISIYQGFYARILVDVDISKSLP